MRYDPQDQAVHIDAPELVRLARVREARDSLTEENEPGAGEVLACPVLLQGVFARGGLRLAVRARALSAAEGRLAYAFSLDHNPAYPTREEVRQARGEAFCAAYLYAREQGLTRVALSVQYRHAGVCAVREESPTLAALEKFFDKLLAALESRAAPELDRVGRRLPTMAKVPFPYGGLRQGQADFISACYGAIGKGQRLFACAPTGIGKTISTLFPAVRALGEGLVDKIFYLTPKGTGGVAAAEAIEKLAKAGAVVRALVLSAKEKTCERGLACRHVEGEACPLSASAARRLAEAASGLLAAGKPVVTLADIHEAAGQYRVCPYELSLCYSEYADVVIGDYNYLFDLRVYLKRFFAAKGKWCFLVDEAHNLFDRARELYSGELSLSELEAFAAALAPLPDLQAALLTAKEQVTRCLRTALADSIRQDPEGVPRGFVALKELPVALEQAVCGLSETVQAYLEGEDGRRLPRRLKEAVRQISYTLLSLQSKMSLYDDAFITFLSSAGEELVFRLLCLDPSAPVRERLERGACAILFSATLRPAEYYASVLGGEDGAVCLEIDSPFAPEQLCVAVMDRIATSYSRRQDSLGEVVRVILTTVKARPGNYMVFCPSFAYMNALHRRLSDRVPGLQTLLQKRGMTDAERAAFLARFDQHNKTALVGFCVMGGIYAESVDLVGQRLIGAVVVGVGIPQLSDEREAMRAYYDDKYERGLAYAYVYPGMNRVLQAAGRVIRGEDDRGVVVLVDERLVEPLYRSAIPPHWHGLKYVGDTKSLTNLLQTFWGEQDKNKENPAR
ncbi:MAG: ATP-dependent DNA helicase [Eubacteriales bacterium]